jgi:hypothetical protein
MIQQIPAFQVGQLVFQTLQEAQKSELSALFPARNNGAVVGYNLEEITATIIENSDEVVAILTCRPSAKPKTPRKPRSDKGKKRAKTPSSAAVNAALQDMKQ